MVGMHALDCDVVGACQCGVQWRGALQSQGCIRYVVMYNWCQPDTPRVSWECGDEHGKPVKGRPVYNVFGALAGSRYEETGLFHVDPFNHFRCHEHMYAWVDAGYWHVGGSLAAVTVYQLGAAV
jgi:hypothetical protein